MRIDIIAVSAIFALSLSACQTDDAAEATSDDISNIRAASSLWVDTYNRNEWPALAMLFTEDAVMMPPNGDSVIGRAAIADWESEYETGFRIAFEIDTIQVERTMAYVRGRSCVFIPIGEGNYGVDVGKFLEVRRQQEDGQWLIEVDAFNSDLPAGSDLLDACPFASLPKTSAE